MKNLKMILLALILGLICVKGWAFQSGDQVFFLHGPDDDLTISRGQIVALHDGRTTVYFPDYSENATVNTSELYPDWRSAYKEKNRRDKVYLSENTWTEQ